MIVIGNKPNQVDLLNFIDGVNFTDAISRSVEGNIAGIRVPILGLEDYISTKKASGRAKDIDDLNRLDEFLSSQD